MDAETTIKSKIFHTDKKYAFPKVMSFKPNSEIKKKLQTELRVVSNSD
jgi:hypothetical protein